MTAATDTASSDGERLSVSFYVTVGLIAGAIIAYQIAIMRVFSVGTWAHFGSLTVSMAMLGFGVMSAIMCIGTDFFHRHWSGLMRIALLSFGPLMVLGNTLAQWVGFNPISLVADPDEKYRLFQLFIVYFVPFLPGALFLGLAFIRGQHVFGKVYFADLVGSGICGLLFLVSLYLLHPEWIMMAPVAMWFVGALIWYVPQRAWATLGGIAVAGVASIWITSTYVQIDVNQYKGVSYARKFPDSKRIASDFGPFGFLEVYASSYLHFAPGLSNNASSNIEEMPKNAYVAMYMDSDGPIGVLKKITKKQAAYFEFLPMYTPFVLKKQPDVFIVQLGGGIATKVALAAGAKSVTVAESNPMLLSMLRDNPVMKKLTGDPLADPKVKVIPYAGRLFVRGVENRFDVIDLSFADSTGLSQSGGFSIVEKYNYTRETIGDYMTALKPDGVLSIVTWNKQDLPKSVPKLLATVISAIRARHGDKAREHLFVMHAYLSTVMILYKKSPFTAKEIEALTEHAGDMSFPVLYHPKLKIDTSEEKRLFLQYWGSHFELTEAQKDFLQKGGEGSKPTWDNLYKLMIHHWLAGRFERVQKEYVFDTRPVTNERPYLAGYVKPGDIWHFLGNLEDVQDEWGYLLLWATLVVAAIFGLVILLIPVAVGWRTVFSRIPGTLGVFVYFFCLGLGYIVVEVGLIGKFIVALDNPTISASVLITGMLFFSGVGSLVSTRYLDRSRQIMPKVFVAIFVLLALGAFFYDPVLAVIGQWPYALRIVACLVLIAPASFLMGFPFATGMAQLSTLGKERFFIWAWGINGCFSVVGAVLVPLVNVLFGHTWLIFGAACVYLLALPAFFQLLRPIPAQAPTGIAGEPQPAE